MKFLLDNEVNLQESDLLNAVNYARTLQQMIESSPQESSFTIGLYGEWGSGKSSILRTVATEMSSAVKSTKEKFIFYDAWKYSNDSFRRTFLLQLRKDLGYEDTFDLDLYESKTKDEKIKKKISWTYLGLAVILVGTFWYLFSSIKDDSGKVIDLAIILSLIGICTNFFNKAFNDFKISLVQPYAFAPEQFEKYFSGLTSKAFLPAVPDGNETDVGDTRFIPAVDKLIIVIDNIDRCPDNIAYQLLTDIKTFLANTPKIIFLIPVDDEALKRHIKKSGDGSKEAEEFLRKLFNVTLRIKPFKKFDLYNFTDNVNRNNSLKLSATTVDIISKEYASNPRRIIQFINNLNAEREICSVVYGKEFANENESLICKILVIREEWPEHYKVFAKNPNLLNDSNYSKDEDTKGDEKISLKSFLDITHSISSNISYEIIEKIFSIHDRMLNVPVVLGEAINNKDISTIEKLITEKIATREMLIRELVQRLEIGIQRGLYQTEVNNLLEIVCQLNNTMPLIYEENRRIHDQIKTKLAFIIQNVADLDSLCNYTRDVAKQKFDYLNVHIKERLTNLMTTKEDPERRKFGMRLLSSFARVPENKDDLKMYGELFTKEIKNSSLEIENSDFPKEVLKYIIEEGLLIYLVSELRGFSRTDKCYKDLVFVCQVITLSQEVIINILQKFNDLSDDMTEIDRAILIERVGCFNKIFNEIHNPIEPNSVLTQIYQKYTGVRKYGGVDVNVVSDFSTEETKGILLEFLLNVYKLSNELIDISQVMEKFSDGPILNTFFEKLNELSSQLEFKLVPLNGIVLKSAIYNEAHLKLLHYIFTYIRDQEQFVDGKVIKDKFGLLLIEVINGQNVKVKEYLEKWSEVERLKDLLIEILVGFNKDNLIRLPQSLMNMTFDYLCDNDNILRYEGYKPLLKSAAAKGLPRHISILLKLIKEKYIKEGKIEDALDIIEEIDVLNESDFLSIENDIENISDEGLKAEAKQIIKNKSPQKEDNSQNGLIVIKAKYRSDRNKVERTVTRKVRKLIKDNKLEFTVANDLVDGDDPDYGFVKDFFIEYLYNGKLESRSAKEHEKFVAPEGIST